MTLSELYWTLYGILNKENNEYAVFMVESTEAPVEDVEIDNENKRIILK